MLDALACGQHPTAMGKHKGAEKLERPLTLGLGGARAIAAGENWLQTWRQQRTITIAKLAKASKIEQARILEIESGEVSATPEEIAGLAKGLGTTVAHIEATIAHKRAPAVAMHRFVTPREQGAWRPSVTDAWEDAAAAGVARRDSRGKIFLDPLTSIQTRR